MSAPATSPVSVKSTAQLGDSAAHQSRFEVIWQRLSVVIVFALFVASKAANRVLMKRVQDCLSVKYNMMLTHIVNPIVLQFCTLCMMVAYIIYMRWQGHKEYTWRYLLPGSVAASTAGAVPLYHFALIGLGDQISAAMQAPPAAYVSQTMQSLISNTRVIWTAGFAYLFLGTRFKLLHIAGCVLVVMSVFAFLAPGMDANDCSDQGLAHGSCFSAYKNNAGTYISLAYGAVTLWYGLYLASVVPSSACNVYKQHVMQNKDVDVMYVMWWSGNFQMIWGLLCIPELWIQLPGNDVSPSDTFQALLGTFSCLLGDVPNPGQDDACATSPNPLFWYCISTPIYILFNLARLWLTKRMSATWTTVATVLSLDLTIIFGGMPFIAGGSAETLSCSDWLATAMSSVALWIYNLEPESKKEAVEDSAQLQSEDTVHEDSSRSSGQV
jgi:hypothetical protein